MGGIARADGVGTAQGGAEEIRGTGSCALQRRAANGRRLGEAKQAAFLAALAGSCNVTRAAREAGAAEASFYRLRQRDEAFAALAPELLNRLLADEERLNNLLRYHVLQGRYTASDLTGLDTVTTLEGSDLQVETDDGLRLDEATVVQPDLEADNGVVHGLDQVMLPEKYLY